MTALLLLLFAWVPQEEPEFALPPPMPTWRTNLTTVGHHFFAADGGDGEGRATVSQAELRLDVGRRLDHKRRLGFRLRQERSFFDFDDGPIFTFLDGGTTVELGDPFDELDLTSIGATLITRESQDVSWLLTVFATAGYESVEDWDDGLTFGGGSTVTFRLNSKFLLTVGAFGNARLEDDPLVYPWLQIDWQPTERLHVGSEGSGVGVGYTWLDELSAYLNVSFVERNFRLNGDSAIPDGVVRDDEFAVNTGLIWDPEGAWEAELYGGVAFRELSVLDDDVELDDTSLDPSPYVALRLTFSL